MLIRSRISTYRLKKLFRCFCEDLTATQTAAVLNLNRNTVNRYYQYFRVRIVDYQESLAPDFSGEVELDESYFGPRRSRGRRGRGTAKIPVFGLKKRNGRVYTQIIKNASSREIRPIIKDLVTQGATLYTDSWRAYDGLVLNGYKHYRINHTDAVYSNGRGNHINGIENFWSYAKRRLLKFNGIRRQDFYCYLKETEFRYNEKDRMYQTMLKFLSA